MEEEYSGEIGWMSGFSTHKRHEEVERVMQLGSIMPQEWDRSMYYLMTIDPGSDPSRTAVSNALRMDPLYWILQKDSRGEGLEEGRREGLEEGRQEALQQAIQAMQQTAINVVAKRFPGLKQHAQESIATVNDLQRLQALIPDLSMLPQGEVGQFLDQLCKDQL